MKINNITINNLYKYCNLVYSETPKDGSCFFHSLLFLTCEHFRNSNKMERILHIKNTRLMLYNKFTQDYYYKNLAYLDRTYLDLKYELINYRGWISHYLFGFISEMMNVNIFVLSNGRLLQNLCPINKNNMYIIIRHDSDHYEPIYNLDEIYVFDKNEIDEILKRI